MRVAIDASALAKPAPGGIARYVNELIGALSRVAIAADRFTIAYRFSRIGERRHFLPRPGPRFRTRVFQEPFLFTLGACDVFHGPDARVPRGWPRPALIATVHDLFSVVSDEFAGESFRRKKIERYADLVRRCAVLLAVSEYTKRLCVEKLGADASRVVVTPEGVSGTFRPPSATDVARMRTRHRIDGDYFLFVGERSRRKNLVRLVEAFASMRRPASLRLVLAGRASFGHEAIDDAIGRLGVREAVVTPGFVAAEDLPSLYGGARAFIFPSLDEGFGLPVLEAMACGAPVIASARGAIPEVAGNAALLIEPESVDDIRNAMATLLEDATLAAELRDLGAARVREFTWERTARLTLDAYRKAANSR
ncbi:MAG: glycosyltransferase family 4 protein [Planctomycetes bacterium]|nr:glycosyltransferase family 4 protein [Planctomycetota bacterium]